MSKTITVSGRQAGKTTQALEWVSEKLPGLNLAQLRILWIANCGIIKPYNEGVIRLVDAELAKRGHKIVTDSLTHNVTVEPV